MQVSSYHSLTEYGLIDNHRGLQLLLALEEAMKRKSAQRKQGPIKRMMEICWQIPAIKGRHTMPFKPVIVYLLYKRLGLVTRHSALLMAEKVTNKVLPPMPPFLTALKSSMPQRVSVTYRSDRDKVPVGF